jgi:hypothetical protein
MKPLITKKKFNSLSFKERPPCLFFNNGYTHIYGSKNGAHSKNIFNNLKFYIPFFLVATRCNKVEYWFEKSRMRGPNLSFTYKHKY